MADDREPQVVGYVPTPAYLYELLVRMALAAGWRRDPDDSLLFEHPDEDYALVLGTLVTYLMEQRGVDLREPVPGEESK